MSYLKTKLTRKVKNLKHLFRAFNGLFDILGSMEYSVG